MYYNELLPGLWTQINPAPGNWSSALEKNRAVEYVKIYSYMNHDSVF